MINFKAIEEYVTHNGKGMIIVGFLIGILLFMLGVFIVDLRTVAVIWFIAFALFSFIVALFGI